MSALKAYPRKRLPLRCRERIWTKDAEIVGISITFPRNTEKCLTNKCVTFITEVYIRIFLKLILNFFSGILALGNGNFVASSAFVNC